MGSDHHLKSLTLARTQAAEEQSLPFSTVICNIVSVNVSCGYGCNCPEKTANNCSNKMEHIRITAGCPTASMPASFTPPVIMQFHKELNEQHQTVVAYLMKSLTKCWKTEGAWSASLVLSK